MARSAYNDPLTRYLWTVWVIHNETGEVKITRGGFTGTTLPQISINYRTEPEGGAPYSPRKIAESASIDNVVLTRGVMLEIQNDIGFFDWMRSAYEGITEHGLDIITSEEREKKTNTKVSERNPTRIVVINHHNRDGSIAYQYILHGCQPVTFVPGSDFNALSDDTYSIESISFTVEEMERVKPDTLISTIKRWS